MKYYSMNLQSKRPYKEALPKNTILKIKNILKEIDILTIETLWGNPFDEIYSVRIEAITEDGEFGQNGKGRNQLFCLASAYAEYMERIQNLLLTGTSGFNRVLMESNFKEVDIYYYPDEKEITKEDFLKLPNEILSDFFSTNDITIFKEVIDCFFDTVEKNNHSGIYSMPFYSLKRKEVVNIPHNLLFSITGSNGMASGNTLSEATFQAMCEIYERNAASIIYSERLTPPTIERIYLSNYPEELNIIDEIDRNGYEVIVKDFSCNRNLPVVGLIIVDKKSGKYKLNIGSDTDFQVALSRTLTEIFQGLKDGKDIQNTLLPKPNEENSPFLYNQDSESVFERERNLVNFMKNGSGIFPETLFYNNSSYEFNPNTFNPKKSYEEEVKELLVLAKNLNYDVYIRDVSFLGFPTVYIYISGVSLLGRKFNLNDSGLINEKTEIQNELENLLYPFSEFINDKTKLKRAIENIETLDFIRNNEIKSKDIFRLKFKDRSKWNDLPLSFLMVIFCYLTEDFVNSKKYLDLFIDEFKLIDNDYYSGISKYIDCKIENKSIKGIHQSIIDGFKDSEAIFQYIGYPNSPDCENCKLSTTCLTTKNIQKYTNIKRKFKENLINQNKFATLV
ncbi:YcaO-like family protein [Flavobacterium psychrophilum]|uniref:YcaO-like family protein n=1 Tax=Flavobacterium psychrophilum TaxID=96345 RepID=UPI000B7C4489|nr:YcaO-like family protein [Flavobacterium psychrophilum]SNA82513.1 conserved hypothetical protein [Flavobacterium psychrophilum]